MEKITLAFVEDHQMVRQMWIALFEEMPEVIIAGESGSLAEAIPMISEQNRMLYYLISTCLMLPAWKQFPIS